MKSWLLDYGIAEDDLLLSANEDWISVSLTISHVEDLLQTQYHEFRNDESTAIRTLNWSLPQHLHGIIDTIQPTTSFFSVGNRLRKRQKPEGDITNLNQLAEDVSGVADNVDLNHIPSNLTPEQACNTSAVTPLCLRTLYGTLHYQTQVPEKSGNMALLNYIGEFNNRTDVSQFLETYRPNAVAGARNFQDFSIEGGINQQNPADPYQLSHGKGREGNLDAQILLGIAHPIPLITYTVGGSPPPFIPDSFTPENTNEPYLLWLDWILSQPDDQLPRVISTSYGDIEHTVPLSYARRVCTGFAMLGARGVSVIFGSGDHGVGHPGDCHSNDGSATPEFQVNFPDSCPWVTSVGATMGIAPEVVAVNDNNGFASGGGFSNYFPRPFYQCIGSVERYLQRLGKLHTGNFNPDGRGYPDVAAQGYRYVTVWNGTTKLVDGTSASAPTFAAIVALVNDALVAEGKPPMGFLNPWLYFEGYKAFTDVTEGSNRGCNTSGFPAIDGWDASTGWGTPWFPAFKDMALRREFRDNNPWYMRLFRWW